MCELHTTRTHIHTLEAPSHKRGLLQGSNESMQTKTRQKRQEERKEKQTKRKKERKKEKRRNGQGAAADDDDEMLFIMLITMSHTVAPVAQRYLVTL